MAENKASFILYCDLIHTVSKLPDDVAGKLFKHILEYVNDNDPQTDDVLLQIAFEPIKQQLKRDLKAWEKNLELKSDSGKLGNLKRWHNDLYLQVIENKISIDDAIIIAHNRKTSHTDTSQSHLIANVAVNVNDTVNVNDNVIKKKNTNVFTPPELSDVVAYFLENGYTEQSAVKAFNYYNTAAWSDSKGNKVKNWKQKMQGVWFKDENKQSATVDNTSKYKGIGETW